jgi:hypothetical protein
MLRDMPHSEYVNWQAIYSIEPFPEERADQRTAELLRMMMITAGVKKIPKISDLMPDWWGERTPAQQTPEQIRANMAIVKATKKKKPKHAT